MSNPFDQFDSVEPSAVQNSENPFDQFDEPTRSADEINDQINVAIADRQSVAERGFTNNAVRGAGERAADLAGGLTNAVGVAAEASPSGIAGIPHYAAPMHAQRTQAERKEIGESFADSANKLRAVDLGYDEKRNTLEGVKSKFDKGDYLGAVSELYAAGNETMITSTPDMAGAVGSLPLYITARTGEMAHERAKNKGLDRPTSQEMAEAAPFAIASSMLERILPGRVLRGFGEVSDSAAKEISESAIRHVLKTTGKEAGKDALIEGGTEAIQEGVIEYVGQRYGTDAAMDVREALAQGVEAAILGGIGGSSVGAARGGAEGIADVRQANEINRKVEIEQEPETQEIIADDPVQIPTGPEQGDKVEWLSTEGTQPAMFIAQTEGPGGESFAHISIDGVDSYVPMEQLQWGQKPSPLNQSPEDVEAELSSDLDLEAELNSLMMDLEGVQRETEALKADLANNGLALDETGAIVPVDPNAIDFVPPQIPNQSGLALAPLDSAYEGGVDFQSQPNTAQRDQLAAGVQRAIDAHIDRRVDEYLPEGMKDRRLMRERFRLELDRMGKELVKGGNVSYTYDEHGRINGRTGSINPVWFKSLDGLVTTDEARKAIAKALAGEKLGTRQAAVIETMLDDVSMRKREETEQEITTRWEARKAALLSGDPAVITAKLEREQDHLPDVSPVEALLSEIINDAIISGVNSQDAMLALQKYAGRAQGDTQKLLAMMSGWARANQNDQNTAGTELQAGTGNEERGAFAESSEGADVSQSTDIEIDQARATEQELEALFGNPFDQFDGEEVATAVDVAASEAATSPDNNLPDPTPAQKDAGNYKKAHVKIQGLDITIENPRGSTRSGTAPDGTKWEVTMKSHYGYLKRTEGADGEHIDVFIGPNTESEKVFIVDQVNADGSFDEHKVLIGWDSKLKARSGYKANYTNGWKVGPITSMSMDEFKSWVKEGDTKKPSQPDYFSEVSKETSAKTESKLAPNQSAAQKPSSNLPAILVETKAQTLKKMAAEQGIKKGSPGYADAMARLGDDYENEVDRAQAELTFEQFDELNSDIPESINRQAYDALRDEYGIAEPVDAKAPNSQAVESKSNISDEQVLAKAKNILKNKLHVDAKDINALSQAIGLDKNNSINGISPAEWMDKAAESNLKSATDKQLDFRLKALDMQLEKADAAHLARSQAGRTSGAGAGGLNRDIERLKHARDLVADKRSTIQSEIDARSNTQKEVGDSSQPITPAARGITSEDAQNLTSELNRLSRTTDFETDGSRYAEFAKRINKAIDGDAGSVKWAREWLSDITNVQKREKSEAEAKATAAKNQKDADEKAESDKETQKLEAFSRGEIPANTQPKYADWVNSLSDKERRELFSPDTNNTTRNTKFMAWAAGADRKNYERPESEIEYQKELVGRLDEGQVSIEEFKTAFASVVSNREAIISDLSKLTKEKLLSMLDPVSAYRVKGEKKEYAVTRAYEELIKRFYYTASNSSMMSISMNSRDSIQNYIDTTKPVVDDATQETLDAHAKDVAEAKRERENAKKEKTKGIEDPKTIDDFRNLHRSILANNEGMDVVTARMQMTPAQRAEYDRLSAEETRGKRLANKLDRKTSVSSAGQIVDGEIIETKHTKKGHDLFVVQLAERVSKEDYNTLNSSAKRLGGYYSSFRGAGAVPGFQFPSKDSAQAFLDLAGGDTSSASQIAKERRDAFEDDKSQSTAERLRTMAAAMNEKADHELTRDRKSNTTRRAGMAARAIESAERSKAMADTMQKIASGLESGSLKFLDKVRTYSQLGQLHGAMVSAKGDELRAKYESYSEQLKHQGEPVTIETADYAVWPTYTAYRSDLAKLARQMVETDGLKKLGNDLLKVADDTSVEYQKFAKENLNKVSTFTNKDGALAVFKTKKAAALSIEGSGFSGKAIPFEVKRGEHLIILSSSEAMSRGIWQGDDKKITLKPEFAAEIIEKAAKKNRRSQKVSVPWQFETTYDRRQRYSAMGIETAAEFRSALREYASLSTPPKEMDKVKKLELAMVGRKKDGLDFFPTPQSVADEMISVAEIQAGMSVLEPSAGMGHIADRIRAFGVEPDVIEISGERRELLEAKGYNLAGYDFLEYESRDTFGFGDTFKADDGTIGVMRGQGGLGSDRVKLVGEDGEGVGKKFFSMDELTPVKKNNAGSGYDRIIMNPPFSDRRDMEHVLHAYKLLKPGGRIVAIVGEGVMFGSDKRATEFRAWLDELGATAEKLEEGTFNDPSLPVTTSVNARMLVIDKSELIPAFSLTSDNRSGAEVPSRRASISETEANKVVARIRNGIKRKDLTIQPVGDFSDFPSSVQDYAEREGYSGENVEGVFHDDSIYLNLSALETPTDVERVVLHELYGHYGVRQLFGTSTTQALGRLYLAIGGSKGINDLSKKYNIDLKLYAKPLLQGVDEGRHDRETAYSILMDELLAHIAQNNKPTVQRFLKELLGAVRSWLRSSGFLKLSEVSDSEIIYLLRQARQAVNEGRVTGQPGLLFMLAGVGDSKEVSPQPEVAKYSLNKDGYNAGALVNLLRKISQEDGAFRTPGTTETDLESAIKETMFDVIPESKGWIFEKREKQLIPKESRVAPSMVVYDKNHNKLLSVFDVNSERPFIEIGNENIKLGSGLGLLYQGLAGWANNNGKSLRPDPRGLTSINMQRRSEQMISAMLKYDNSGMIEVDSTQFAGLLSDKDYKSFQEYGKESFTEKLDALKLEYWGSNSSLKTNRALTDARINNLQLAAAAMAKKNAPREFENAIIDSKGNVRQRSVDGEVVAFNKGTGGQAAARSLSAMSGVGYSVRQRTLLALQSVFGGKIPSVVDGESLRRANALQSIGRKETPDRHEGAGVDHPRQNEIAKAGTIPLYSLKSNDPKPRPSAGVSVLERAKSLVPRSAESLAREAERAKLNPSTQKAFDQSGNKDQTIIQKIRREAKRQLTPSGLLPDDVYRLKIERDSQFNADEIENRVRVKAFNDAVEKGYGKPYDQLSPEVKAKLNAALKGEAVTVPVSVREQMDLMRDEIKRFSNIHIRQLIDEVKRLTAQGKDAKAREKLALLQTISENLDTYLHRSYRAFDDENWPKKVSPKVFGDAVEFMAKQYADGEAVTDEHRARAEKKAYQMLHDGTAFDSMSAFISEGKLGAKDLSIIKRRKDISPEIRALLGEYEDAPINYVKSATKMARLVYNHEFLNKLQELGVEQGFLFDKENTELKATKQIAGDGSEVYAPLNGLYTYPEFEQALRDALGKENMADWYRMIIAANGMVKFGKTVLSPTTAMRNFYSAFFFSMANGHFDLRKMKDAIGIVRTYFTHSDDSGKEYMKKLRRLGVVYDSPYASEMMELLKDSRLEDTALQWKPLKGVKGAIDYAQKFYSFGDDFWKIIGFENEKALLIKHKKMSESEAEIEAAERIRNTYPTYSMTGRFVNTLRRFPLVGTFVSFPAEIIRTSYHITRYMVKDLKESRAMGMQKLAGFAIAAAAVQGLSLVSKAMLGVDDDEEAALRALAPEWQRNSSFLYWGRDEKGSLQYLDLSFLDPYNYWKRPINAVLRDQPIDEGIADGAWEMLGPFFGQDIAFGAITESINNKKSSGGRIFNPEDDTLNQTADISAHLAKAFQPGIASNLSRIYDASQGKITASGKKFDMGEEMAALAGFRMGTFDPKTALYYQSFGFMDRKRNASTLLNTAMRDPNKMSHDDLRDAYGRSIKARERAYGDMINVVNAAKKAGMSHLQIVSTLRNSGITAADARALARGEVPKWKPSKTMMTGAIKKAAILFDQETADEFKRREKFIKGDARK